MRGRPVKPEYFETPPPHITANFLDRTVGLRVGNEHYGAPVASYEFDRERGVFQLTEARYPDLFALLLPEQT